MSVQGLEADFFKNQTDKKLGEFADKQSRKILVVEDDLELTTILNRVLKAIDPTFEVDWVTSAEQAMALIEDRNSKAANRGHPYDLVLVDIFLEGSTTGLDLWTLCEQFYPKMPIVVTSALPVDKFFATLGPQTILPPFLPKPFLPGECKQLLEGILNYGKEHH